MSKEFYSVLGDQLCSLKNSPFYKLGQRGLGLDDPNILRSQLSYDPNRLFNKEKYEEKNEGIQDEDFIEMKQEERQEEERIQFDLLREATLEDFEKKVKELKLRSDDLTAPKQHTIFRSTRSICLSCHKCSSYRGNFGRHSIPWTADPTKTVQFLSCIHCRCPMNAHDLIRPLPQKHKTIWSYMKSKGMKESYLNVPYFVAAFVVNKGVKAEEQLLEVAELLEKVGFKLKNYQVSDKWKFEMGLVMVGLLQHGEDPSTQQTSMRLAECISQAGRWTDVIGQDFKGYLSVIEKINQESRARMLKPLQEDDNILVFLIETDNFNSSQQRKLFQSLEEYIKPASLLYISNHKTQSILLAQQFFSQEFVLCNKIFLLPQSDSDYNLLKFRDIIDYNGYSVVFENVTNIKRVAAQNMLSFLNYHQQSYILGKDIASQHIPKLPLIFAAKAGPQHLNHYGQIPSFIQVPQQHQEGLIKQLFPDYGVGQRAIIILRPMIAGSGFQEVVVNLLRINRFTIIQRIRGGLSIQSAHYLAALQHIRKQDQQAYLSFMTTGICEVLLVSKKSALYDAHVLLNTSERSLADINPRWIRNRPSIEVKKGKDTFKEEFNFSQVSNNDDVFSAAGSLLNLSNCLFGVPAEGRVRVLQNCRTGELIKVAEEGEEESTLKVTLRQRQEILSELKKDNFNYLLFNSKSQKSTEQLVSIFFPDCTLFESTVILLKPSYLHLLGEVKHTLAILRYHIIFCKTVQLSHQFAQELIDDLQKLKMDRESIREAIDMYNGQKVSFLCVSKLSARKQLLFLLSNFNFLPTRTILQNQQSQSFLKEVLVPIWTNEERYLKVFNRHLSNLQEAAILLTDQSEGRFSSQDKLELTEYFVGSVFGTKPDHSCNTNIGRLSMYCTNSQMALFQSWYYATLSNVFPNSVPLLFQYRMFGKTTLVVQSYSGQPFVDCIVKHYLQQYSQQQKSKLARQESSDKLKKRNSIALLLWAKKIFRFIEEISVLNSQSPSIPIEIEGWGRIIHHNNQYRAELTEVESIERDRRFLESIIAKYATNRYIQINCKKMLASRILHERYADNNRRLLPGFSDASMEEAFRVVESSQVSKLFLKGEFEMIDPDNEKNASNRHLLTLNLYRVCPYIGNRYSLLAQMLLFFDRLQVEAVQYRQVFETIFQHLQNLIGKYEDLQFLQFEVYLMQLHQLLEGETTQDRLRAYPALRKGRVRVGQEVVGKNRKFLDQKQYFKPSNQQSEEALEQIRLKFMNFNLKTLEQPSEHHILNQKEDPMHNQWNNQAKVVNLLRQEASKPLVQQEHRGVFVEYEKVLNENEERVKGQLEGQVHKLSHLRQETVLRDRGIDDQIWYKRVRSGVGKSGKVDQAISKQLQKLNRFKSSMSSNQTV